MQPLGVASVVLILFTPHKHPHFFGVCYLQLVLSAANLCLSLAALERDLSGRTSDRCSKIFWEGYWESGKYCFIISLNSLLILFCAVLLGKS